MLSVLISTRNGSRTIGTTLQGLCNQTLARQHWEVIVIDNGSTDKTLSILQEYAPKLPLVILTQQVPGKNRSLNFGLEVAKGDLIVFTDDDVEIGREWLKTYHQLATSEQSYDIFGGPIYGVWPFELQPWIAAHVPLGAVYAITTSSVPDGPANIGHFWGPNIAVRSSSLRAFGKLPENVGPAGLNYAMGSESAFLYPMAERGHKAFFCNSCSVGHIIRSEQMSPTWILGRAERFGRGQARLSFREDTNPVLWFNRPRWAIIAMLKAGFRSILGISIEMRLEHLWNYRYHKGYCHEYRRCLAEFEEAVAPPA